MRIAKLRTNFLEKQVNRLDVLMASVEQSHLTEGEKNHFKEVAQEMRRNLVENIETGKVLLLQVESADGENEQTEKAYFLHLEQGVDNIKQVKELHQLYDSSELTKGKSIFIQELDELNQDIALETMQYLEAREELAAHVANVKDLAFEEVNTRLDILLHFLTNQEVLDELEDDLKHTISEKIEFFKQFQYAPEQDMPLEHRKSQLASFVRAITELQSMLKDQLPSNAQQYLADVFSDLKQATVYSSDKVLTNRIVSDLLKTKHSPQFFSPKTEAYKESLRNQTFAANGSFKKALHEITHGHPTVDGMALEGSVPEGPIGGASPSESNVSSQDLSTAEIHQIKELITVNDEARDVFYKLDDMIPEKIEEIKASNQLTPEEEQSCIRIEAHRKTISESLSQSEEMPMEPLQLLYDDLLSLHNKHPTLKDTLRNVEQLLDSVSPSTKNEFTF